MALQVWLPLNGDLHNQGISNLKFSIANSSTTLNANGKIGQCYYNNSNSAGGIVSDNKINLGNYVSMFCWVKMTNFCSSYSLTGILGQHRFQGNEGLGITMKYVSGTTGYLSINTGNGSNRTYNTYCGSTLLNAGTWYHVGFTYNNGNIIFYVNGKIDGTATYSNKNIEDYIQLFCWSFNSSSITQELHENYKLNGYLNDVRIYDHCLSPKEVHEISKGLVLHYKLDDPYTETTENLFSGKVIGFGNRWQIVSSYPNGITPQGTVYKQKTSNGYYGNADIFLTKYNTPTYYNNKFLTFSCWYYRNSSSSKQIFIAVYGNKNGSAYNDVTTEITRSNTNKIGEWAYGTITIRFQADLSSYSSLTYIKSPEGLDDDLYIADIQLEEKDHATPYVNGSRIGKVYDCSGYQHNGTISGTLTLDDDSPRYGKCTVFGKSQHIYNANGGIPGASGSELTVSCWFYQTDRTGYQGLVGNRGAQGSSNSSSPLNWYLYTHSNDGSIQFHGSAQNKSTIIPSLNTWHHVVAVVKYTNKYDLYLDGIKVISDVSYTWGSTAQRTIVSGYGSNNETFKGKISDVRIYATALSEADIKDLYDTPTFIDNQGDILTGEIVEESPTERELYPLPINVSSSTITIDGYKFSGRNWPASEYIPINPSGKTYYYDVEYSNTSGNHLYIGFEKYDANKASGSNQECNYIVGTTSAADHVRVTGTIGLSTANGNTAAYTKLRILNDWDSSGTGTASHISIIHYISLKEVSSVQASTNITKNGLFIGNTFINSKESSISKTGNVIGNQFIEI